MLKQLEQPTQRHITSGTKEWADYNVNCIKGCFNNCRYCYAKLMAKRFGRATCDAWKNMTVRGDVLNKKFRKMPGRVMFPSSHDIIDISPFKDACFHVLRELLNSGNYVLITTKPRLTIVREICHQFNTERSQIQFRFTITSIDDRLLEFWEPNAPRFKERLNSLEHAFLREFKTSVSIEPFLDYDPSELVETVSEFTTESIWIGRMNYIRNANLSDDEKRYYTQVRRNYDTAHLRRIYRKFRSQSKVRFKDSIRIKLGPENLTRALYCKPTRKFLGNHSLN